MSGDEETAPDTVTAERAWRLFNDYAYDADDLAAARHPLAQMLDIASELAEMLREGHRWDDLDRAADDRIRYVISEAEEYLSRTRETSGFKETEPGPITDEEAYHLFNDSAYVVDDLADGRAALEGLLEAAGDMEGMLREGGSWDDLDSDAKDSISYWIGETNDYLDRTEENPDFRAGDAVVRRIREDQDERDATDAVDGEDA